MRKNTLQNKRRRLVRSLGLLLAALLFTTTAKAVTVEVTIQEGEALHFAPLNVDIHVGDTVTWIWNDGFYHSATSGNGDTGQPDGVFDSGIHHAPFSYSVTFQNVGTFPYFCASHRGSNHSGVWPKITVTAPTSTAFFMGEVPLGNGIYYLQFANSNVFGYYSYFTDPRWLYHFDMGYEYWFDANDGQGGIFFYDFASGHFFYTSPNFPFPYLYDFSLNTLLYYYPDPNNSGHYTTNPRYFYNFATQQIITM